MRDDRLPPSERSRGAPAWVVPAGALLGALLVACASTERITLDTPKVVKGQDIRAYAIHEECLRLQPGDRLDYDFTSNQPVDFNIHYHEGPVVIAPIVRDKTLADSGILSPLIVQDYCLMWEAGAAGSLVDYRIVVRRERRAGAP